MSKVCVPPPSLVISCVLLVYIYGQRQNLIRSTTKDILLFWALCHQKFCLLKQIFSILFSGVCLCFCFQVCVIFSSQVIRKFDNFQVKTNIVQFYFLLSTKYVYPVDHISGEHYCPGHWDYWHDPTARHPHWPLPLPRCGVSKHRYAQARCGVPKHSSYMRAHV